MSSGRAGIRRAADLIRTARARLSASRSQECRVGYIGWAGRGNLGDDAMFEAARAALTQAHLLPYEAPQRERLLARMGLSGPRFFHSVVLGGGTLISPNLFPDLVRTAQEHGVPVWSWGTGAGSSGFEMETEVGLGEWRGLLPRVRPLGVRGPRTRATLAGLGMAHAEVTGDLALCLARDRILPPQKRFALNIAAPGGDAVAVEDLIGMLAEPLARLVQGGWTPVPIAMTAGDTPPTTALLARIAPDRPDVHQPRSADELLDLLAPCAFTVAVRLHAAVFSCCAGVPPLMLGYRDKCLDFMESVELAEWHLPWETATPSELQARLTDLAAQTPPLRQAVLERAQGWQRRQHDYINSVWRTYEPR